MFRACACLAFLQCTATTPTPERPVAAHDEREPQRAEGGQQFLVGVLGEVGTVDCPDGSTQRWSDVRKVIGWTPVTLAARPDTELFDRPVVARGEPTPDARPAASEVANPRECPIAQMRSDMVETPRGVRLRRDPSTSLPHFRVDELRPLAELDVRETDGKLAVEFRNPLPVELGDLTLVMHYEGCHGKPGTAQQTSAVGALAVGAGMRASFPSLVDADRGRGRPEPHRASSLQILAKAEHAHFDLDVRLSAIGTNTTCPDEGSE